MSIGRQSLFFRQIYTLTNPFVNNTPTVGCKSVHNGYTKHLNYNTRVAAIFTTSKNTDTVFLAKSLKSGCVFVNFNLRYTFGNILFSTGKITPTTLHIHSSLSFSHL